MNEKICPQCHFHSLKTWDELSFEEKMIVERLPMSASIALEQRKKNLFCSRCWYEQIAQNAEYC